MALRWVSVLVNEDGDIVAWKAIAGAKTSHKLAKPVFPAHQPNFSLDKGIIVRIKAILRPTGALPLDTEYTKRR